MHSRVSGQFITSGHVRIPDILAAISVKKRLEILAAIALKTLSVSDLAHALEYDIPDISSHLRVLRECGLVKNTRVKKDHIQSLTDEVIILLNHQNIHIEIMINKNNKTTMEFDLDPHTLKCIEPLRNNSTTPPPKNNID